jgi:hypothetical protein
MSVSIVQGSERKKRDRCGGRKGRRKRWKRTGNDSTTVTRDGEELPDGGLAGSDGSLLLEKGVDHEKVAGSLKLGVTKPGKAVESVLIPSLADIPAG